MLSLSLTPTALIGLNKDLKVPKSFTIISNAKPSTYKYPEFLKKEEAKAGEKVSTAVLSTTVKVRARVGRKQKEGGGETAMQIDTAAPEDNKELTEEEKQKKEEEEKKALEPEPESQ